MNMAPLPSSSSSSRQRGVSLFVVLVMVLLTTLLVLWGSRTALFNEMIVGNDSDYQRALEAAQAMVRDAEFDIMGTSPDGTPCATIHDNCRPSSALQANQDVAGGKIYFPPPNDVGELEFLQSAFASLTPKCKAGICVQPVGGDSPTASAFWLHEDDFDAMKAVAATYGLYTGAKSGDAGGEHNPLLATGDADAIKAWYWVEPIRYQKDPLSITSGELAPTGGEVDANPVGVVYRITAVADGLKRGTRAVIQTVFVRKELAG